MAVLTPASTDLFQKVGLPGSATTLASPGFTIGNTGITVGSTTNHPTDTLYTFAIDRAQTVNGVTSRIAGTYCEFEGIVASGTTIGSMVLKYGTSQSYPAGSFTRVYIPVSSNRENQLVVGLRQDHNGKGNHQSLTDDNGNTWFGRSQVASAVNNLQAANAAAGSAPSLSAVGSDTNIDVQIIPKGTGVGKIDGAVPRSFFALYNFIESGCVWSGTGYGTTLVGTMTSGFVWINGKRLTVAAVATRTFTASKDTYIDFQDAGNGTATVIYTEVANNAASPAIPNSLADATNIRNGIVVSGATFIAAATSINQGQEDRVLPIASSVAYAVTDSLGNLICPRDPNRRIIGYKQILANQAGISGITGITGLRAPIIVPTGRKIRATIFAYAVDNVNATATSYLSVWEGVTNVGTRKGLGSKRESAANSGGGMTAEAEWTPTSSNITVDAGYDATAFTGGVYAGATNPTFLRIELV